MILPYVVSCAFFLSVVQANLEILFDDAFCEVHDTNYIAPDCGVEIMEDSEFGNYLTMHLEIKQKLPILIAEAKLLEMDRTGEYTQDVGLSVTMDICEALTGPPNIAHVFVKALDLNPDQCPPEPGVYIQEHFVLDTVSGGLPKSFPGGKYFLSMSILLEGEVLVTISIYFTVM